MAIGRPIELTPNITSKNISIAATEGQTEFTVTGGYRINEIGVYRNGVRLVDGRDFSATDGQTVTFISDTVIADDIVEFSILDSFDIAGTIVSAASTQTLNGDFNITGNLYAGTFKPGELIVGVVTANTALYVGSALTANAAGDVETIGIVTAGSFSGDGSALTGVANTDYVISIATTTGNLNVSAAATITGEGTFSSDVSIGGTLTVTGDVSVGGTLSYQDVTNVDAVGLITARSGVNVSGGQLTVGVAYSVGNAGVVTAAAYHGDAGENVWTLGASGTDHYTFTGPGDLSSATDPALNLIRGQRYRFENRSGGHPFQIQREYQNTSGTAYNDGVTNNGGGNGTDIIFDVPYDAPAILYYQCTAHANMSGYLYIGGSGYEISVGTGITFGSAGVATFADGGASSNALKFGSGGDLIIYHDGSNSMIDNNTGNLNIQSDGTIYLTSAAGSEVYAQFSKDGAASLRYDNSTKLATTTTGVTVTGTVAATNYTGDGSALTGVGGEFDITSCLFV